MARKLSAEEHERRRQAVLKGDALGLSRAEIARSLGLKASTLNHWCGSERMFSPAIQAGRLVDFGAAEEVAQPVASSDATRVELRGSAFWRARAAKEARRADEAEHLLRQIAGLMEQNVSALDWPVQPHASHGHSVVVVHTSDVHYGEVIVADENAAGNAYNPAEAEKRMRRLTEAACVIGKRWCADDTCDGVLLTMAGDLVSGDIHEELLRTNELTSLDQVLGVAAIYAAMIERLLKDYPRVHVAAVPGNHGRTTQRPSAKLVGRLSYDIMVARMVQQKFEADPRVTWTIASGSDALVTIYGYRILVTHGDAIGTGGGQGFAGAELPIVRGGHKVQLQASHAGQPVDIILMGHFHHASAPRASLKESVLANGSVAGYSEFAHRMRAPVDWPRQWLARLSLKWGLCERQPIILADRKARVRVRTKA